MTEMEDTLQEMIDTLDLVIAQSEAGSVRARAVASLQRFSERGQRVLQAQAAGAKPLRILATAIELRDLSREEERWIDDVVASNALSPTQIDVLLFYKAHLVQIETTTEMAIAFVSSDKENEDGVWWARRSGELIGETIALAPTLVGLPSKRNGCASRTATWVGHWSSASSEAVQPPERRTRDVRDRHRARRQGDLKQN